MPYCRAFYGAAQLTIRVGLGESLMKARCCAFSDAVIASRPAPKASPDFLMRCLPVPAIDAIAVGRKATVVTRRRHQSKCR